MSSTEVDVDSRTLIKRQLSPSDNTIPYRFVGSFEYLNALGHFERLASISTPEEISVYDKVLNERAEFTFFNGLNTAFAQPPDLSKANPEERTRFSDQFQKGGLAWMMALARIEVGATLSMYSDEKFPYESIMASKFGSDEYLQLLLDDVTAHMKSLANEGMFKTILRFNHRPDTWTLAYLRRLKLVKDMLVTISRGTNEAIVELARPYYKELAEHEATIVGNVNDWLAEVNNVNDTRTITRHTSSFTRKVASPAECSEAVQRVQSAPSPGESPGGGTPKIGSIAGSTGSKQ